MVEQKRNIPDIYIEQYLLEELDDVKMKEVEKYVETPEGKERLEALKRSNDEILKKYPVESQVEAIKSGEVDHLLFDKKSLWDSFVDLLASPQKKLAFATALTVSICFMIVYPYFTQVSDSEYGVRLKGMRHHILVYRKDGDLAEKLDQNSQVFENDELQVSYVSAGLKFGVIFSVDGNGSVTLHHPKRPGGSTRLKADGEALLTSAFRLDNAPSFEKFYFLASEKEFNYDSLISEITVIASQGPSKIESKLKQYSEVKTFILTLKK